MRIRDMMTADPTTVRPDQTVYDAAQRMVSLDVGALPVVERDGQLVGIVTDRDITIRAVASGLDPNHTPVRDVMTVKPVKITEDQHASEAAEAMKERGVRRMLVTDEEDNLKGICTLADFATRGRPKRLSRDLIEHLSVPSAPMV